MADTTTKNTSSNPSTSNAPGTASYGNPPNQSYGSGSSSSGSSSSGSGSAARQARERVNDTVNQGVEQAGEMLNQAKQTATDAYQRASEGVNKTYEQAIDYGRENPGKATLIAFGVGVGVGLLLANNSMTGRSRARRIAPPVINALSEIAAELFR